MRSAQPLAGSALAVAGSCCAAAAFFVSNAFSAQTRILEPVAATVKGVEANIAGFPEADGQSGQRIAILSGGSGAKLVLVITQENGFFPDTNDVVIRSSVANLSEKSPCGVFAYAQKEVRCRALPLVIKLSDNNDHLNASLYPFRIIVAGRAGADLLFTGTGTDRLFGGDQDDQLFAGDGADKLFGGNGNDMLAGGKGADVFVGDAGIDTVNYGSATANVTVTLNRTADDGSSGENDDVRDDVENIFGGPKDDTLSGNGAVNVIRGRGGSDTITGSLGDDSLFGDAGDDTITGGGGIDRIDVGDGADFVDVADGLADIVTCGAGRDTVKADAIDRFGVDCENVV